MAAMTTPYQNMSAYQITRRERRIRETKHMLISMCAALPVMVLALAFSIWQRMNDSGIMWTVFAFSAAVGVLVVTVGGLLAYLAHRYAGAPQNG